MENQTSDISHLLRDPVYITWIRGKKRQKTIQKRIFRLLKRQRFFILNTGDEELFIDGGAWVWQKGDNGKYNKIVGNAQKFFPFIQSRRTNNRFSRTWEYIEESK